MSIFLRSTSRLTSIPVLCKLTSGPKAYSTFSGISYRIATPPRYDEIQDLLFTNFWADEPMSSALKMYDGLNRSSVLEQYATDVLNENMSIMAIDEKTDEILGICINEAIHPSNVDPDTELQTFVKAYDDPKFVQMHRVIHAVNQKAGDLFKEFDTNTLFYLNILTIGQNSRKGGLGKDLLHRSVMLAETLGFSAIKTEATGLYSRKAMEKLGFHANAMYSYSDYKDEETGYQTFSSIPDLHGCVTLMTKKLTN